jgi:replicative DNA helicase
MTDAVIVAEYRLLNALAHNKAFRNDSRVHEDVFLHETARSLYQAIMMLEKNDINISPASLLQAGNEIDFNVTKSIVDAVYDINQEGINKLDDIIHCLDESKKKKLVHDKFKELSRKTGKDEELDADALLGDLFEIDTILKTGSSGSLLKDFSTWSDEYIEELRLRSSGKRYTYGEELLDKLIRKGAYPGAITTIAASTGQGKSTYVLNLISHLIDLYIPCMYISLEMSGTDTYDRLLSFRRGIPTDDLYTYDSSLLSVIDIVEEEKRSLEDNKRFYFVEEPDLSLARIRALIKEFKQRSKSDYAIIAIDLLSQVKDFMSTRSGKSVANAYEEAMNTLNALAKSENVHVIGVVQFGREADNYRISTIEDLDIMRPTLNNIKNSHAIAERSRVVLSAFRKKYYADRYLTHIPEAAEIPDIMEIQVLKNSSGTVGNIIKYMFEGTFFRLTPILDESVEERIPVEIDY